MASDLHKVVEKAREASAENQVSSLAGVVYRGSGHAHSKTISLGALERRLLEGTIKAMFPQHCSKDSGVCFRRTVENTGAVVESGLVSSLLMASVRDYSLAGTWKESIYVAKEGVTEEETRRAAREGALPTMVCYLTVRR